MLKTRSTRPEIHFFEIFILAPRIRFSFGQRQEHGLWPQPQVRAVAVIV